MIERVAIDGADLDLADVFASVTIRHGRATVDDPPIGSTATLTVLEVSRAFTSSFRVGVPLEIDAVGAVPRFRGRFTDAELSPGGELSLLAVSTLARIAGRPVGGAGWPIETWTDRVERVFTEAGELARLVLEPGELNPTLAARAAGDETTLAAALQELADTVAAAIADLPDGKVLVQALTDRKGRTPIELDPAVVAHAPEWGQADDVRNVVRVEWSGGTVEQTDASSIADFEERQPLTLRTALSTLGDANARALLELNRRARPDWRVERAELLELDAALAIGEPVQIGSLQDSAPDELVVGILEGWTDRVEPDGSGGLAWTMELALSPTRLSGWGISWEMLPVGVAWEDVPVGVEWNDPEPLLSL